MLLFGNLSEEKFLYHSCNFCETLKLCQNKKKMVRVILLDDL